MYVVFQVTTCLSVLRQDINLYINTNNLPGLLLLSTYSVPLIQSPAPLTFKTRTQLCSYYCFAAEIEVTTRTLTQDALLLLKQHVVPLSGVKVEALESELGPVVG